MKIGIRVPSLKKSISARTTGKVKRDIKKAVVPGYGKKGTGWIKDPKKAAYNKVYNKTTVNVFSIGRSSSKRSSSGNKSSGNSSGCLLIILCILFFPIPLTYFIWTRENLNKKLKIILTVVLWLVFAVIVFAVFNENNSVSDLSADPQYSTVTEQVVEAYNRKPVDVFSLI